MNKLFPIVLALFFFSCDDNPLGLSSPDSSRPSTTISFSLPESEYVSLHVYNILGQMVSTLIDQDMDAGLHEITWDASGYSSGIFFISLIVGSEVYTQKITLIK